MRKDRVFAAVACLVLMAGCTPPDSSAAAPPSFKDCAECPEMVMIPAGEYVMGSPPSEPFRGAEDQHTVTIGKSFAMGKYEVTFDEWDACIADGGCRGSKPDDQGWGRGRRPVIDVSWPDAKAYADWLGRKTGKRYRLATEAEWEYAARAGTKTPFSFGATITTDQANYDGAAGYGDGPKGVTRGMTVPVGSFPPNAFGLHDMHGNVWEWVEDCYSDEYTDRVPRDGSAYLRPDCLGRVMRGGSWEDHPGDVRAAARVASEVNDQTWSDGFRVVREME
jgi:formylglycine-generating enzyme required for sulfatase activity